MELKIDNAAIAAMVQESIKVAAAAALSQQSPALINRIVEMAMSATPPNSYGRETIFEAAIKKAINDEAKLALEDWIAEHRPLIRKRVHEKLMAKKELANTIADKLVLGLSKDLRVNAYLTGSD